MTAEFTANKAREFTNKHEEIKAELWYAVFKDILFERITSAALDGDNSISLQGFEWNNDESQKRHLTSRLEQLGYSVNVKGNMVISW